MVSRPRIDLVSQTDSEGNTDQFDKPQLHPSVSQGYLAQRDMETYRNVHPGLYRSLFIRRGRFIKNDLSLQNIVNNSGGDDSLDVTR